ncbi:restriction endonuclease subunit S [Acinetobacter sp. ANC 3832]|uniref:restriction endonuclease subunit S n=1 Tax=Acinetobacter sp. ANC 3832 TaxID=1977874 RepID=UPI001BB46412|nr:restriction endonuclease subunit S [Acinetobacter sp. ANC 3832]
MSWQQVKLGDIFEIARGGSPRPIDQYITDDPNGLNWISIKDASNSSKYIYKTEKKIKPDGLHKTRLVHPDDFLLTNSMSFGRPYIMKTTGCIHDGWLVLSADKSKVDTDYFYHLLGSDFMYQKFKSLAAGAVVKNLNTELVKSVSVPLPPLAEQRRIASILDQADTLRQKRQQAIKKLDHLLQATFIDMFGDPVSNPKGFEVKKLSEQVDLIQIGPFGTQLHQEDYIENGIPLINPSHNKNGKIVPNHKLTVSQSKYEELTQYHLRLNDVLLGRRGEMGRCAVVTQNEIGWLCGTGSLFLRPNVKKINPFFLELLLSSDSIKRYLENVSQGQTMANLNKTIVGSLPLIAPSIEIQNNFFLIAEKIDKMKTELKSARNQVNNLFESLQNQAFNGTL